MRSPFERLQFIVTVKDDINADFAMIVDEESQQAPQIVNCQFHTLFVYKEVPCAIHDQRLLRCQRRDEYRAP
ncbi:hypothetical protein QYM36_012365 [Artemia franciscana]|uniref:Uncharacterized protein n=1 Tax=Artemia franciscana TaxID=6661 RepID=A0AA88HFS4_ARTSF|nr:hypothetical protein QYM36_012365 [Artemia franciscana]